MNTVEGRMGSFSKTMLIIVVAILAFYFFWELSTLGAAILLLAVLWWQRHEIKELVPQSRIFLGRLAKFIRWAPGIVPFSGRVCQDSKIGNLKWNF